MLEILRKVVPGAGHKHSLCSQGGDWAQERLEGGKGDSAETGRIKGFMCCQVLLSVLKLGFE